MIHFLRLRANAKPQFFLKFCIKKRSSSSGLLLPYVYFDLSCPHWFKLLSSPLSSLPPSPSSPSRSHKSQPSTSYLVFSGTRIMEFAFPEPALPQGAETTLQINHSLDLVVQVLGNRSGNRVWESAWLVELRKVDSVLIDEWEYFG